MRSASSTATLPTEVAPRPMPVCGADLFGRLQGGLEQPVGEASGELGLLGGEVGLLDLARDLRFPDHHGIEAAGDGEKVLDGFGPFLEVEVRREIRFAGRELREEPVNVAVELGGHAVDFHPVAGGEQDDFGEVAGQLEAAAVAAQPGGMDRQLLAQFDRRGPIAQPGNEEFHVAAARGERRIANRRPARREWSNLAIRFTNSGRQLGITE